MAERDYTAVSQQYAKDVVGGKIPGGRWLKAACQRSLDDWRKASKGKWAFRWDVERAKRVCAFVELLPHLKGPLAGTRIRLEPWQVWALTQAFAWVHEGGPRHGMRRFRRVYIEVPRGSGKSCLSSAVALYALAADGDQGAEVYSAATKTEQARIVFNDALGMARHSVSKRLMNHLGVSTGQHAITVLSKNSRFVPLSAEAHSLDGLNISFAVIDELHAHQTRDVYDVLLTGAGKRPQSLIWCITTAGFNLSGICYEVHSYLKQVLQGVHEDHSLFGCIWSADEDDDWCSPATWRKANPNWEVSVDPSYVEALAREAQVVAAKRPGFLTKHLNLWQNAATSWAHVPSWQAAQDPTLELEQLLGQPCYVGLDLASKNDLAAKVLLFPKWTNGKLSVAVFPTFYLPDQAIQESRNASYKGWWMDGHITRTEGEIIDYERIEQDILADAQRFDVREVAFDPWSATQLAQRLMAQGINMVQVNQTVRNLSEPMKELDALTRSGRLSFNNPVLLWCASNVVVQEDHNGNIFPRKLKSENKIDGITATLNALARVIAQDHQAPSSSVYQTRGLLVIG